MESEVYIENFNAGTYGMGPDYKFFIPEKINRQWKWHDPKLNSLLESASIQLGQLNSFAKLVPNIDLFIHLHVTKEAVVSSRIEGTQTRMDEALLTAEDILPERRSDWQEVQNYTQALRESIADLKNLPLSSRLFCRTHQTLLHGVRGKDKQPGAFRKSQNWIGGASLSDAVFIPPAHSYVQELMGDLENFLHNDQIDVPFLIRTGIAHYQFETIHPFLDGNGRIGRLLITLYLVYKGYLDQPLLYLSVFFEKNKNLYYDNLTRVRQTGDLLQWLKYFLVGIEETSSKAAATLREIISLQHRTETTIRSQFGRRASNATLVLSHLFKEPFVQVSDVRSICKLTTKSAGDLVRLFVDHQMLKEYTGQSRNRIFVFEPYLQLFE